MYLHLTCDSFDSHEFSTPIVIGRADDADVSVTDIWASRHHCEINDVEGEVILRDLNSTHGTLVNGESVIEKVLRPGDEVVIGITRFTIMWKSKRRAFASLSERASATRANVVCQLNHVENRVMNFRSRFSRTTN